MYIGAAVRSLILPGWGQLYKGEKTKAQTLISLAVVGWLYTLPAFQDYKAAKSSYDSYSLVAVSLPFNSGSLGSAAWSYSQATISHAEMVKNADRVYRGSLFLAGVYLYSLADSYFKKSLSTVGYYLLPERNFSSGSGAGVQMGMQYYFYF